MEIFLILQVSGRPAFSWQQNGERFGYLHRDGRHPAKGNLYKGPFHLPNQEWYCVQIVTEFLKYEVGSSDFIVLKPQFLFELLICEELDPGTLCTKHKFQYFAVES
jgi:hypothetical protein